MGIFHCYVSLPEGSHFFFRPFIGVIALYLGANVRERQARQALEVQGAPEAQEESWIDATRCEDWWGTTSAFNGIFFV